MSNIYNINQEGTPSRAPSGQSDGAIVPVPIDLKYIQQQKDNPKAKEDVAAFHGELWDVKNGGALKRAELEEESAKQAADEAQAEANKAKVKADNTDQYKIGSEAYDKDGNPEKGETLPYSDWPNYELAKVIILFAMSLILLALGGINIAVLILSSGIPIFLEHPSLAILLAFLVPAIAIAIKSGETLCQLDRTKHRYATTVYVLAFIAAIAWIVLFTVTFEGNTANDIWTDIEAGEADHSSLHTLRNIFQILVEVLIGGALFSLIERTHNKFSSNSITERAGWRELKETADSLGEIATNYGNISNDKAALRLQIAAARQAFILEAVGYLNT